MSFTDKLPATTARVLSRKENENEQHLAVYSLQLSLRQLGSSIKPDGWFGPATEKRVKIYQRHRGLYIDGVAGHATQSRIVLGWSNRAERLVKLPKNLLKGIWQGEGGGYLAPVNWAVADGVDIGAVQQRVYQTSDIPSTIWYAHLRKDSNGNVIGPTDWLASNAKFDPVKISYAVNSRRRVTILAKDLRRRHDTFLNREGVQGNHRKAWELAVLYHNWPQAADLISRGYIISDTPADWVPQSLRDQGVVTKRDWAEWYIATMTRFVAPGDWIA